MLLPWCRLQTLAGVRPTICQSRSQKVWMCDGESSLGFWARLAAVKGYFRSSPELQDCVTASGWTGNPHFAVPELTRQALQYEPPFISDVRGKLLPVIVQCTL